MSSVRTLRTTPDTAPSAGFNPEDLLSIEELARRLHTDVAWVREKTRRRCHNPIPVYNLGRHLLFDWTQVTEWIRNCPRPVHARHFRRKKSEKNVMSHKGAGNYRPCLFSIALYFASTFSSAARIRSKDGLM